MENKKFPCIALVMGLMGIAMKITAIATFDGYIIKEFPELVIKWNYLGFFTYTTNIMVDFWLVLVAVSIFFKLGGMKKFLTQASVQSFLTAMIFAVGFLYCAVILWFDKPYSRELWWGNVITFWHHAVTPALMAYLFFHPADKARLGKKDLALWLVYPIAYLIFTMLRGGKVNWYPYPFLDHAWETFADLHLAPWLGISLVIAVLVVFFLSAGCMTIKIHNKKFSK